MGRVTRVVHVPYVVEQDEDGDWSASAHLRPGVAAFGEGET
jgi:predicted RNase H-like HicB family nuclease